MPSDGGVVMADASSGNHCGRCRLRRYSLLVAAPGSKRRKSPSRTDCWCALLISRGTCLSPYLAVDRRQARTDRCTSARAATVRLWCAVVCHGGPQWADTRGMGGGAAHAEGGAVQALVPLRARTVLALGLFRVHCDRVRVRVRVRVRACAPA